MAKVLARHTFRQRIIGYLVSHCNKKWLKSKLFRFKPFQPHPTRTLFCLQLASVRRPIRRFVKSQHRKWFRQSVTSSCMEVEIIARKCFSRCCNRRWAMSTTCCMISWSRCDLCFFTLSHWTYLKALKFFSNDHDLEKLFGKLVSILTDAQHEFIFHALRLVMSGLKARSKLAWPSQHIEGGFDHCYHNHSFVKLCTLLIQWVSSKRHPAWLWCPTRTSL